MQADRGRRPSVTGLLAAVVGLSLFVYFLQRAGVGDVLDGVRRLGWVFAIVVGLGGLRFAVRAAAWMRCLDGPHRLTWPDVLQAVVVGDALGNLTPLSIIVSEPAKGMFLRHREPLGRTLAALAVENLFYTLSAVFVMAGGLVAVVLMFQTSGQLFLTTAILVGAMVAFVGAVHWVFWTRTPVGSGMMRQLHRLGVAARTTSRLAARIERIEHHIYALYPRDPGRLVPLALLECSFHALAMLEIYVVLSVISDQPPTLLHAFVFESTNRFITVAFRFIPLRIGVDEAGTGLFANLLAFGTTTGVTLAIVRKGRMLLWIAVGVALLVRRGLSVTRLLSTTPSDAAIVIMARSPVSSTPPKTRLAGPVTDPQHRRRLYRAFLQDTIAACRTLGHASLRLAHTPDTRLGFDELGVDDDELIAQRGDDLGARERSVFAQLFASGFSKVVMVGSDLPTVPIDHIVQALDTLDLDPQTVVLGPAEDGGYYLLALAAGPSNGAVPDLFSTVRWSTRFTLEDTVAAATRAGLRVELLSPWYDVDDEQGLSRLRADLERPGMRARAPSTARVVDQLFGPPVTG